ncbi:MAG: carboxypeptidase-like regulatory domain-containing protein [Candidatus Solibacter sp.]
MQPIQAQGLYGALVGNVTDPTIAGIPEAKVKLTNLATNQVRETQTTTEGVYSFPTIPPGPYEVEISREGFQTVTRRDIPVTINTSVRVDVTMQVGTALQSVEVTGQTALLQTDRADVHAELTTNALTNLPLPPGRNYELLFVTIPGFQPPSQFGPLPTNPSRVTASTVNGASRMTTGLTVDGASNRSVWMRGAAAFAPALEAIETVNVVTNSMSADQGMAGAASISVNIKSGTNNVHGTLFEYNTNNKLTTRAFFLPANQNKPKYIQNQFGGAIGGPIKRNKLFFFLSWEATLESRLADNNAVLFTVPTAAIRSGNMSGSTTPIYDPATGNPDGTGRTPFPDKIVPLNRQSTIVTQGILPLLPQPTFPNLITSNYYGSGREYNRRQQVDSKINYNASNRLTVSGRVSSTPFLVFSDSAFGNDGLQGPPLYGNAWIQGTTTGGFWNGSAQALYQAKPNLIIDTAFGFTLEDYNEVPPGATTNYGDKLGIPGANGPRPQDAYWPQFSVSSYTNMGAGQTNVPLYVHDPQFSYVGNVNWTKMQHNIRFGGELRREHMNHWEPYSAISSFSFNGNMTSLNGGPGPNQYNSYADFLLGTASGISKSLPWNQITTRTWFYRLYVRDQWQVSRQMTVSYGVGWEYYPPATREDRGMELYNFNNNTLMICGVGGTPTNCGLQVSKKLFAPRVGIAYRLKDNFVIRAGYGITYDTWSVARDVSYVYPVRGTYTAPTLNSYSPAGTLATGIPPQAPPDLSSGSIPMPLNISTSTPANPYVRPYIQSFNVTLQKELKWGWVAQSGYVATRTVHNAGLADFNAGMVLGAGLAGQPLYQKFGRSAQMRVYSPWGSARYDSLQSSLERRFAQGYSLKVAWTFSKNLGMCCGDLSDGGPAIYIPQYYNLNKAILSYDLPQNFSAMGMAQLPFGKGKHWLNSGGVASALLSGWQLNGVFVAYSGNPLSVSASGASLNTPANTQRANQVLPNVDYPRHTGPGESWFNPLAFAPVTTVAFGTAGFNTLRGPGTVNLDASLFRDFSFSERIKLQFRFNTFNSSNTPHFNNPATNVSNMLLNGDGTIRSLGGYSTITSTKGTGRDGQDQRVLQFGMHIRF